MTRRTRPIAALSAFLVLASACGSTNTEPAAQPEASDASVAADNAVDATGETAAADTDQAPTESPAPANESGTNEGSASDEPDPEPVADTDGSDQTDAGDAETDAGDAETDAGDAETDAGDAETGNQDEDPAAPVAAVWPDDGCSTDGSPTPTDAAEGPAPALEVRAESADSLLPAVPVRRINCNGGWVNFQNELPSSQPLLVWFWAPH